VKVVNIEQKGAPASGPYPVVVEHDQKLATHTIYRVPCVDLKAWASIYSVLIGL